jgi:mobilization protein NikA
MVSPDSDHSAQRRARGRRLEFRLSDEEYAELEAKARAADISMSALLRDHFGRVRIRHRQDERRRLTLLNRINANLNMIARWVNTHKGYADAAIVQAHLLAIEREITRLIATLERR